MCSKVKSIYEFKDIFDLVKFFSTEKKCLKYIVHKRWGDTIRCIDCDSDKIYKFSDGKRYKCAECKRHFTALVGTVFQDTQLSLQKWIMAMYLIGNDSGISTRNLAKKISVSVPTAWFLSHRIRQTFYQSEEKLTGVIECDESFVGGKNKNRHIHKKVKNSQGRSFKDKVPVFGVLQRGGKLKTKVIPDTKIASIRPALKELVEVGSTIYSDEWLGYRGSGRFYNHTIVDHKRRQFRNGDACTNGIEGAWASLKRMIAGVYYRFSKKHLFRYINEFTFRYNVKNLECHARLSEMFKNINRPLKYKQLISAA